jgi:hypothetical protein
VWWSPPPYPPQPPPPPPPPPRSGPGALAGQPAAGSATRARKSGSPVPVAVTSSR